MRLLSFAFLAFTAFLQCGGTVIDVTSRTNIPLELEKRNVTLGPRDERVDCYNIGTTTTRDRLKFAADWYCENRISHGITVESGGFDKEIIAFGDPWVVYVYAYNINGCPAWTINDNCYHILYAIMDNCNTDTVTAKQGGELWDPCGHWRLDPGNWDYEY
ncbi:hypothetical protein DL96DRAFT_1685554 [Flagelloscypha sp. PMI_526]|nr:hypothetical protein DL96DRAFT_1685554 [Flagelloscypha sp. PMI_526]